MTLGSKKTFRRSLLAGLVAAAAGLSAIVSLSGVSSEAHGVVAASLVDDAVFYDSEIVKSFYETRDARAVWTRGSGDFQPRADKVLLILEESWTHGLNPEKYHVEELRRLKSERSRAHDDAFDRLMTDGVIRYVRDLTGMRDKRFVDYHQVQYWRQPMEAGAVIADVALSADPVAALRKLEPGGHLYTELRRELIRLSGSDEANLPPITIAKAIKPGQSHPVIPQIRQRLGGDHSSANENQYDDALAARVMTLQRAYGLTDDGVLRASFAERLSRGREAKIAQIIANLERLRWLDQTRPDRYVLVNVPSTRLWAVDNGEVALEMPVIIGKEARPTHSFKTDITGVRLNPNWTVPPTIKKEDFLPALQADPDTLNRKGISLHYQGKVIDSSKIDWSVVKPEELRNVRMVQAPGDENPLGKIRVIMDNPYNIYLHDTNNRGVFEKQARALSSGCVRVAEPEKLAWFILKNNDGMDEEKMSKMIASGRMRDVASDESIPVYITYQTIWLDDSGMLVYGDDVYGQDKKLIEQLRKSGFIHVPNHSKDSQISL